MGHIRNKERQDALEMQEQIHKVEHIEDVPFQYQLDPSLLTSANAH